MNKIRFATVALVFAISSIVQPFASLSVWQGSANGQSREIGFVEEFVLSSDREKTLEKLIPGTEAYYYFHCLHFQNAEQFGKVESLLKDWIKRHSRTGLVRQIQNRQALLSYDQDPEKTLAYLRRELGLTFNHQREIPKAELTLPTKLDPGKISYATLAKAARAQHLRTEGFTDAALYRLASEALNDRELRHLLERMKLPDSTNLVELIHRQLTNRDARPFGTLAIHRALTKEQLDGLLSKRPRMIDEVNFVNTYMTKLKPSDDEMPALARIDYDEEELKAYLDRMWAFVNRLSSVHNSLKVSVLYHQLQYNLRQGKYDRELFEKYIQLPRQQWYVNPKYIESFSHRRNFADINAKFQPNSLLPPIRNDEPLIRRYLQEFFKEADDWKSLSRWLRDDYLKRQFAETKIINGLGDAEQWASLLGPEQYKALVNRIDLEFLPTNPRSFDVDEIVKLSLNVKNVDNLLVKIFEINTENYYKKYAREIDTDINLDGLVPNWELNYQYQEGPSRQVKRSFEFKDLNQSGVYVIDFIGNGISSRALVRKGHLHFVTEANFAGQKFTIYDWKNQKVDKASIWIGGREFKTDKEGTIQVPFSTNPGRKSVVVTSGRLSSLGFFNHIGESYQLKAGFFVDREALLRNRIAKVTIRPALFTSGWPTPLSAVKNATLHIQSVDQEGITASKTFKDVKLNEDFETEYEFGVPARLNTISFTLQAKVDNVSQGQMQTISASHSMAVNQIDKTTTIRDLHLVHSESGYALDVRGKNGGPIVKQAVLVTLKHRMFTRPVVTSLQTDEEGRITLGKLDDISSIKCTIPGAERSWKLVSNVDHRFASVHGAADETIQIPYSSFAKASPDELALFELRGGVVVNNRFDAIKVAGGLLTIKGLSPGNYRLVFKNINRQVQVRITAGEKKNDIVFGKWRHLELRNQFPLVVQEVKSNEEHVAIKLGNASPNTRVHIFATRFQPRFDAFDSLMNITGLEPFQVNSKQSSTSYIIGRNIGDEYRYILDRKYAQKFAGNMLTRPSLLLRPWSIDQTQNFVQPPKSGGKFGRTGTDPSDMQNRSPARQPSPQPMADQSNLDFLALGSAVLVNLKPSDEGVVIIDRKLLTDHFNLQIVAIDRVWTSRVQHFLNETPIQLSDNRLAKAIDPEKHFALRKQHGNLADGEEISLPNTPTSKFQRFDDLGDVYQLMLNLSNNTTFGEFRFILSWPDKTDEEKRKLYSKYACHELNYFLFKKDQPFFENVVKPFIQNKRDKTFFDHWLLASDTEDFMSPWQFNRLNVAERILLSQRLEENRQAVRRNIFDMYELNPTPVQFGDDLFSVVFGTEGLVTEGKSVAGKPLSGPGDRRRNSRDDAKSESGQDRPQPPGLANMDKNAGNAKGGQGGRGGERSFGLPDEKSKSLGRYRAEKQNKILDSLEMKKELAESELDEDQAGEYFKRKAPSKKDADMKKLQELRQQQAQLYRRVQPTKVWVETNYYRLRIQQHTADRVPVNEFWKDYASHDGGSPFLSPHFGQCTRNFTEMMLALAVIDLPFEPKEHEQKTDNDKITFKSAGPVIVFHQQVRPAIYERRGSTVLVSENFFRHDDRYQTIDGKRYDKFVRDEFLRHILYGGQVVVTNPTSTPKTVDILIQIPEGSMPAAGSQQSRSVKIDLAAFSTQTFEYHFFFPQAGSYQHYPAHVSDSDKVLAVADTLTFNVLDHPKTIDKTSWAFISQNGTEQQVLDYLNENNTLGLSLEKIAFRLRDKTFFEKVVSTLKNRMTFNATLWSYAIYHNSVDDIRDYLLHRNNFLANCGRRLHSKLVTLDPIDRRSYEHREFWPLFNARQHPLGARRQITNPKLWTQYHLALEILSQTQDMNDDDELGLTYYLLLQDRVETALEQFKKVDRSKLETGMQYDYCRAYLAMYTEDVATAKSIASKYAQYPVNHWREHFENLLSQIAEIESDAATTAVNQLDRDQKQAELAAKAPAFEFEIVEQKVKLNYQNLNKINVNYYKMDIELLFSRNPFVQAQSGSFALIRPNMTASFDLPKDKKNFEFEVPTELANHNVLVEISAAGQTKSAVFYSHSLAVKISENYGQIQVRNKKNGKPLAKVYVKVYAQMKDGSVKFYKDGYTDLRGRYDYSSLSNQPLDNVRRFSMLVLSEENGAIVRQAGLPLE